eukprot:5715401-Alexandrium_andersonii.AAC.1
MGQLPDQGRVVGCRPPGLRHRARSAGGWAGPHGLRAAHGRLVPADWAGANGVAGPGWTGPSRCAGGGCSESLL